MLACAPASCLNTGCPGYEFNALGTAACGVDGTAELGTIFLINFTVFDNSIPPLSATITRAVTIVSPCADDEFLCADDACSAIDCDTRDLLGGGGDKGEGPQLMLNPGSWAGNWTGGGNANATLRLMYKQVAPLSLLPCASLNKTAACFAVARDTQDGDLTPDIIVEDVTCPDAEDTSCYSCTPTSLTLGTCPAGKHRLRYHVTDAHGNTAQAFVAIVIDAVGEDAVAETFTVPSNASTAAGATAVAAAIAASLRRQQALALYLLPARSYDMSLVRCLVSSRRRLLTIIVPPPLPRR